MPLLWKYSLRGVRMRPGRATLTLLSVVIGVAAVVSVSIGTATTRRAYEEMFATVTGRASLEVVGAGGSLDEGVLPRVAQVPGVRAAVPVIQRPEIMYPGQNRRLKLVVMGIDPQLDRVARDYYVQEGDFLGEPGGIALDADLAQKLNIRVGQEVKFLSRGMRRYRVVGLLEAKGTGALRLGGLVFMRLDDAQDLLRAEGELDSIQVVLDDGANLKSVRAAIASRLPPGLSVHEPAGRSHLMEETLKPTEIGLHLATAFSLLLAAFIILNVFLMNVGERRQQLAIMRAVGATQRQIAWILVRESLVMGALGTALGIVAGLGGARLLTRALDEVLQLSLPSMILTPGPFILAMVFGFGLSLLGAAMPARRASRLTPLEALGAIAPEDMEGASRRMTTVGVLITLIAGGFLTASILGGVPNDLGVVAGVLLLIGLVLLLPLVLAGMTRVSARLLAWFFRVETRLARRQVLRHRGRSTLTIGVLFLAISTGIGLGNTILDNVRHIRNWYRQAVTADFVMRAMMPDMATGLAAAMPPELDAEVRRVPGLTAVEAARFGQADVAGQSAMVVAREFSDPKYLTLSLQSGDRNEVWRRLSEGEVVVGTVLAQRAGLHVGQMIPLQTVNGVQKVRIAGLADEYLGGGLVLFMQFDVAQRLLGLSGTSAYLIHAEKGQYDQVRQRLQALADKYGLLLHSQADVARIVDRMIDGITGSLWGLLILGFVVAAFGVVNTLTMNVLEQTRELGLLRIVAMTRRQVRRTILVQAVIIGVIGLVPGTVAGLGVAYLMYLATLTTTGHAVQFVFRPELLLGSLLVALVIVIISAWGPAERAARLELGQALHYE